MIEAHPAHALALPWLQRVRNKVDIGLVATHSLAELYAILTTLPIKPRISPAVDQQLIKRNVLDVCEVVSLSGKDYATVIDRLSDLGITGGATYAASKANADQVVTLNEQDFRRVHPDLADRISSP
jgi:predicted nucleic acid-binding protein